METIDRSIYTILFKAAPFQEPEGLDGWGKLGEFSFRLALLMFFGKGPGGNSCLNVFSFS